MTANVEIVLEDHPNVLIIPAQYVQYEGGEPYVEVAPDPEDTTVRVKRTVKLGFSDGLRFEIAEGVEEGETIVLEREIEEEEG
jgi:HlyD family secretion protein